MPRRRTTLPVVEPVDAVDVDLTTLELADLRESRRVARGRLEFAQLRMRQSVDIDESAVARLRDHVQHLTDELISRYVREPELIDTILETAPAREVSPS